MGGIVAVRKPTVTSLPRYRETYAPEAAQQPMSFYSGNSYKQNKAAEPTAARLVAWLQCPVRANRLPDLVVFHH